MKTEIEWISFKDKLPPKSGRYMVTNGLEIYIDALNHGHLVEGYYSGWIYWAHIPGIPNSKESKVVKLRERYNELLDDLEREISPTQSEEYIRLLSIVTRKLKKLEEGE